MNEDRKELNKICPLLSEANDLEYCYKEKCQWWFVRCEGNSEKEYAGCVMSALVSLEDMVT